MSRNLSVSSLIFNREYVVKPNQNGSLTINDTPLLTSGSLVPNPSLASGIANKQYVDTQSLSINSGFVAGVPVDTSVPSSLASDYVLSYTFNATSGRYIWSPKARHSTIDSISLYDGSSRTVANGSTMTLRDPIAGLATVEWYGKILYSVTSTTDSFGTTYTRSPSVDWGQRFLTDSTSLTVANWENKSLLDNNSVNSLRWNERELISPIGNKVMDWNSSETTTFYGMSYFNALVNTQTTISTTFIDWKASNHFIKTLSSNTTLSFSNTLNGQTIRVLITNPSTYTVSWPAGIKWEGGSTPVQTTGSAPVPKTDIYEFIRSNSIIYGRVVSQNHF